MIHKKYGLKVYPVFWESLSEFYEYNHIKKSLNRGEWSLKWEDMLIPRVRTSPSEVFLAKGVLKIYNKFTAEHPCQSMISGVKVLKLLCNFIEVALRHGCSSVNLMHIFRTPFHKKTSGRLLLESILLAMEIKLFSPKGNVRFQWR